MGVISVGASLGVKDDGNAHPIITSAPLPLPTRRRIAARSPAGSNSVSVSPSAVSARAHYGVSSSTSSASLSSSLYHQPFANGGNNNASSEQQANRKKPLRRRATTATSTSSSGAATSSMTSIGGIATGAATMTQASSSASAIDRNSSRSSHQDQQDEMGQWQVTRVVAVPTSCDPQVLLPHVIGNRGARINAIMSQAKCIIVHRKRDTRSQEANGSSAGFSMSFQVSADTIKRVDHGSKLLRSAVENAEQLTRGWINNSTGLRVDTSSSIQQTNTELENGRHASQRRRLSDDLELDSISSRADVAMSRKRKQADARGSSEDIGNESKRIHRTHGDVAAAATNELLDIDEFRIRLQRSAAISRKFAQEAARAQSQAAIEKQKYVAVLRKAEAIKHKRRVSDLVVKVQCAVLASPGSSSSKASKKKRVKIEQLSSVQDACWSSGSSSRHVIAPDIRIPRLLTKGSSVPSPPMLSGHAVKKLTMDDDLVNLFKKIEAFKKATGSSPQTREQDAAEPEDAPDFEFDGPSTDAVESSPSIARVPVSNVQRETRATASISGHKETQSQENRRESFRSTWDIPGLTRDLNLVQDYSEESDCKLLQLVVGERQYFYMEPLLLDHGMEDQEALKRWILTEHDVQLVCSFLSENDQYGKQIVQSLNDAKKPESSSFPSESSELFQSSKKTQWSAVQRQLVNLHSLTLAAHLLGYHYHAMQSLRGGVSSTSSNNRPVTVSAERDILTDETLKSDLFKYILRPIRSSAIESSLLDSLPISLVRETVEHCPEVLNHVLNWKEEENIPVDVAQDIQNAKATKDSSAYLRCLMDRLSMYVSELDAVLVLLGEKARSKLDQGTESLRDRDNVIFLTNQLKDVMAKLVVENIKLQLHKWATVFLENSCSWFDPDFEDGYGSDGDRTYDKFTCLQDALFVWHNQKVLYSAKDDLAEMEETKPTVNRNGESELNQSHPPVTDGVGVVAVSKQNSQSGSSDAAKTQSASKTGALAGNTVTSTTPKAQVVPEVTPSDNELTLLKSLTPADMLDKLVNRFTMEDLSKHFMSVQNLEKARTQLYESLHTMKTLMDVMGRSAPWRTHVKNSNALKRELAKQGAIEKKLLLHQWAFFYKRHQGKLARSVQVADHPPTHEPGAKGTANGVGKSGKRDASIESGDKPIDWTGVFDANDSADVIVMKKLRHELQVTNSELAKRASSSDVQDPLNTEHKALMRECNALTRSCVAALSKFLGESVDDEVAAQIYATSEANTAPRRRARSRSVINPDEVRSTSELSDKPNSKGDNEQSVPVVRDTSSATLVSAKGHTTSNLGDDDSEQMEIDQTGPPDTTKGAASTRLAKGATELSDAGNSNNKGEKSEKPAVVIPVTTTGAKSARKSPTARTQSQVNPAPLRMGCSGCRDLRRRCTGCFGCCLHCVCVSCGCRMCCSTRFSAVQKTLAMLVSCVEANDGCKWVQTKPRSNSMSSDTDSSVRNEQFTSRICGMLRICFKCLYCGAHCTCPRPTMTRASGAQTRFGLRGRPAATRKERRFKAKLAPTQRRTPASSDGSANDQDTPVPAPSPNNRRAASSGNAATMDDNCSTATPAAASAAAPPTSSEPLDEGGNTDSSGATPMPNRTEDTSFPLSQPPPRFVKKDQGKNEQEDLFRAARVRMKLQRNTFSRLHTLYGSIPANTFLDGEMLWQPERIRMMWERKDFFGVLGVPRDATTQQIKRQYRKLALKLHPDKTMDVGHANSNGNNEGGGGDYHSSTADERVEAFVAVTHSYKLLSGDPATINSNIWKPTM